MKYLLVVFLVIKVAFSFQSCSSGRKQYTDLNTGLSFDLVKDPKTALLVDKETGKPLTIYVDEATKDTIYGRTGEIINGRLKKMSGGLYAFNESNNGKPQYSLADLK